MLSFAQSPLEQAVTLTREKKYSQASELLRGVAEPALANQRIAFHRLKAAVAAGLNDPDTAAAEMRQAVALAPNDASVLAADAIAELNADQLANALAAQHKAVAIAPSIEDYRAAFGFELIRHGGFRAAIAELRNAVAAFPKSTPLRVLLGIAQYASSDIEDARATLSEAISADPAAEPAYRSLARIVLQSSAVPEPRVIDQLCSWDRIVCSAIRLRVARERDDAALLKEAVTALEQAPAGNAIVPCELARAYEWSSRMPQARTAMEKCVAGDPSPQNHFRLGVIYQRLGLPELARQQMDLRSRLLDGRSEETTNALSALGSMR